MKWRSVWEGANLDFYCNSILTVVTTINFFVLILKNITIFAISFLKIFVWCNYSEVILQNPIKALASVLVGFISIRVFFSQCSFHFHPIFLPFFERMSVVMLPSASFSFVSLIHIAATRERSLLYKSKGKDHVLSTSWKPGLDMAVVNINKSFLCNKVRPAFWEVDGTWSFPLLL